MATKLKIGVLGAANIAIRSIIPTILELGELFEFCGVASRSAAKSEVLEKTFGCAHHVGYDVLLDLEGLDAVYIPLPNALHKEWVEKALLRGLHVLVEKSMTCSLEDTTYLVDLARSKGLVLLENFQFQRHSQLVYLKALVEEGRIGELRCVRSSFGFPPFKDAGNIRYNRKLGGGALLDAGTYPLKISQYFLGPDLHVAAANLWVDPERGVDIWGGAYLKQNRGPLFSEIAFGFDHHYQCSLELWGTRGKVFTNRIFTAPPGYHPVVELETAHGRESIELADDNHFINMLSYFHQLATAGSSLNSVYDEAINQARLLHELQEKASNA